jgi:hypothetical protein
MARALAYGGLLKINSLQDDLDVRVVAPHPAMSLLQGILLRNLVAVVAS